MGTWGTGVLEDDLVADIVDFVSDLLKQKVSLGEALTQAIDEFSELDEDEDDGHLLWLAIAHLQWTFGSVEASVLRRVRHDIELENGLEGWRDDPGALAERKTALTQFLAKIERPNPKPSTLPETRIRQAPFRKGDCLSVLLPDGNHTACLVLKADNDDPENGRNLVVGLDYYEPEPPTEPIFSGRKWLYKNWGAWNNELDICWYLPIRFAEVKDRITVVGSIRIKWTDPKKCDKYAAWESLGSSIVHSRTNHQDDD